MDKPASGQAQVNLCSAFERSLNLPLEQAPHLPTASTSVAVGNGSELAAGISRLLPAAMLAPNWNELVERLCRAGLGKSCVGQRKSTRRHARC